MVMCMSSWPYVQICIYKMNSVSGLEQKKYNAFSHLRKGLLSFDELSHLLVAGVSVEIILETIDHVIRTHGSILFNDQ